MYKKCKVVMLATNKATWPNCIWLGRISGQLRVDHSYDDSPRTTNPTDNSMLPQHLYILSDDEIKEGDWWMYIDLQQTPMFPTKNGKDVFHDDLDKKIIASTNSSLNLHCNHCGAIKQLATGMCVKCGKFPTNSIPSIPQSFIDKYINEYNKGNKIEEVYVHYSINGLHLTIDNNNVIITDIKTSWTKEEIVNSLIKILNDSVYSDYNKMNLKEKAEFVNTWINDNL